MNLPNMVLFDVDGTLIGENDEPRDDVIDLLLSISEFAAVGVWSGSGGEYAEMRVRRLGLGPYVEWTGSKLARPLNHHVLFTVDDVDTTDFGVPNLTV